jgi:hypothetical protein
MRMTAVLILLVSGNCVANMEMNKSEEEMDADYSKQLLWSVDQWFSTGVPRAFAICHCFTMPLTNE